MRRLIGKIIMYFLKDQVLYVDRAVFIRDIKHKDGKLTEDIFGKVIIGQPDSIKKNKLDQLRH